MNIFIEESKSYNPYENLAYEAALADFVSQQALKGQEIYGLFLWQNDSTIVFGRHQCIKSECDMALAKEKNVTLARRMSGGGAVYHDLGNLNFTFISRDCDEAKERNEKVILKALEALGIKAEISGRNDILTDGKKFSGNAYSSYEGLLIHHGTIMVKLDKELATRLLTPPEYKLKSKGIKSVSSRIVNLSEINPDISIAAIKRSLSETFIELNANCKQIQARVDRVFYDSQLSHLTDPSFVNKDQLPGQIDVNGSFGTVSFSIEENHGKIGKILYESDILQAELLQLFMECLKDCQLTEESLTDRYDEFILAQQGRLSADEKSMLGKILVAITENIGD